MRFRGGQFGAPIEVWRRGYETRLDRYALLVPCETGGREPRRQLKLSWKPALAGGTGIRGR